MISENSNNNEPIIDAIIHWHRNATPPPAGLGLTLNGNTLEVAYGYNGNESGKIAMARGQFEITHATNANGALVKLTTYNHAGSNKTKQKYIDALKDNNLTQNQERVSALIIMTSESCRSQMVSSAINAILNDNGNFNNDTWSGLEFAFNNYGSTAEYLGYDIQAGGKPWSWLRADNYLNYIEKGSFTGDKPTATRHINAVKKYIADASYHFHKAIQLV